MTIRFTARYSVVVDVLVAIHEDTAKQTDEIEAGSKEAMSLLQTILTQLHPRSAFQAREELITNQAKDLLLTATGHSIERVRELLELANNLQLKRIGMSSTHDEFRQKAKEERGTSKDIGTIENLWNAIMKWDDYTRDTRRGELMDKFPQLSEAMGQLLSSNIGLLWAAEAELIVFADEFRKSRRHNYTLPILAEILHGCAKILKDRRAEFESVTLGNRITRTLSP